MKFVIFGNTRFSEFALREKPIALELAARGHEVVFIEQIPSIASKLSNVVKGGKQPTSSEAEQHQLRNLRVLTPPLIPTFFRSSLTPTIDRKIFRRWFRKSFTKFDWNDTVLIIMLPLWWDGFIDRALCPATRILYDCYDALEVPSRNQSALLRMNNAEDLLAEDAALVCYSSKGMKERLAMRFRNAQLLHVPNAVTESFLKPNLIAKNRSEKCIGYIGALDTRWVDLDLLHQLILNFPDSRFVFYSRLEGEAKHLNSYSNVSFEPLRLQTELVDCISQFDVCLIPFKTNSITQVINPIKLYEYLSTGSPIVATNTDELSHYPDLLYLATSHSDFTHALKTALAEPSDDERRALRIEYARNNTWKHRVDVLLHAIAEISDSTTSAPHRDVQ